MKNKKIIAIPALLALLGGAAFVANNAMNTTANDNGSVDMELTQGMNLSVTPLAAAGTVNWASTELNASVKLTMTGVTLEAVNSSLVGINKVEIVVAEFGSNQSVSTWNFSSNDCGYTTAAQNVLECTKTINVIDAYSVNTVNANVTQFVERAYAAGKATQNGVLNWTVGLNASEVVITDNQNATWTKEGMNNPFNFNIKHDGFDFSAA